jgi:nicotinate phosphoribosyltransferase
MSLVSELYFKMTGEPIDDRNTREKNNLAKGKIFYGHNMKLADFGTRRRYSYDNQFEVCKDLKSMFGSDKFFVGTSNAYIAMQLGLTPIGTYAHEFISGIAALQGYAHANKHAMDAWISVYNGDLGIALPDTFGLDAFLKDFDLKYALLYTGVRHDSGSPYEFVDKIVAHYSKLKIDPLSKTIVFSDGLNTELSLKISEYCSGKIKCSFGIGTDLTNLVGIKPLNIVIKLVEIDGNHAIKLSDNLEKSVGDKETIEYVKWLLGYKKNISNLCEIS